MSGLLPIEEALNQVLADAMPKRPVVYRPLLEALGLVLAEDILSPVAVPLNDYRIGALRDLRAGKYTCRGARRQGRAHSARRNALTHGQGLLRLNCPQCITVHGAVVIQGHCHRR